MNLSPRVALLALARIGRIAVLAARTLHSARRVKGRPAEAALEGAKVLSLAAARALEVHGLTVRARGPLPRGPALLVANHLSYLDPLLVASQVGCVPVAKAELASWPLFGTVARRLGVLFVERSSPRSRTGLLREVEQLLRLGGRVLNFPEGTTSDGKQILPFRKGLFGVAQALDVQVVPLALRYRPEWLCWIGDATFVPHYLRFAATRASEAELIFGDPLPARAYATSEALAEAARVRTLTLLMEGAACLKKTP